jgi:hypothetical protein
MVEYIIKFKFSMRLLLSDDPGAVLAPPRQGGRQLVNSAVGTEYVR